MRALVPTLIILSAVQAGAAIGGESVGNYVFTVPQGWTRTNYPDGVVYISPMYNGEKCQLTIFPTRPTSGDLLRDAIGVFQGLFKTDPMTGYPFPSPSIVKGTSPYGWDYLVIRKSIGGYVGASLRGIIVFVARLGNDEAVIVGSSKDPLVSQCFGEIVRDEWPRFFYSLRFKNWNRPGSDSAMMAKLAGTWTTATGSAADRYTFAPNGRYATAAAAQYRARVSSTEVLQTTHAFFGDGAYAIRGNTITLTSDNNKGSPNTGAFRLEQESKDGRTWAERLCIMRERIGDLCYQKER